jgi:periplasmic protein TonB
MNRVMTIALLGCLGLVGGCSCAKEEPPKEAVKPAGTSGPTAEAPEIPIDVMPKLIHGEVFYPEEARARGEQGIVKVKALVGKDGKVTEAAVDTTSPAPTALGRAAVDAVRKWTFEPATTKGEPVAVWIVVPVNFKLR